MELAQSCAHWPIRARCAKPANCRNASCFSQFGRNGRDIGETVGSSAVSILARDRLYHLVGHTDRHPICNELTDPAMLDRFERCFVEQCYVARTLLPFAWRFSIEQSQQEPFKLHNEQPPVAQPFDLCTGCHVLPTPAHPPAPHPAGDGCLQQKTQRLKKELQRSAGNHCTKSRPDAITFHSVAS